MTTHDEHREALVREVMDSLPANLTPQERVAAMAFAVDVLVFEPGHPADRMVRTPLDDPMWLRRIHVTTARRVKELARALVKKGLLESVQVDDVTRYRFPPLSGHVEGPSDGN
jgi:hypothetical protein